MGWFPQQIARGEELEGMEYAISAGAIYSHVYSLVDRRTELPPAACAA